MQTFKIIYTILFLPYNVICYIVTNEKKSTLYGAILEIKP